MAQLPVASLFASEVEQKKTQVGRDTKVRTPSVDTKCIFLRV
jgi:hypothetical protein